MALTPLAAVPDLNARSIDTANTTLANTMLAVASATVRGAAGSPISQITSTVTLTGWWCEQYLRLPGPPVTAVATVTLDGTPVTDWRLDNGRLWRCEGWGVDHGPTPVAVTYTHGLPAGEYADLVDLVCALTAAGMAAATEGYESHGGVVAERIDDYSVTYAQGAEAVATAMELPARTRAMLRARFGTSAGTVTHR